MNPEVRIDTVTSNRHGKFGDYDVSGLRYGELGWNIRSSLSGDEACHEYWVEDGEFYLPVKWFNAKWEPRVARGDPAPTPQSEEKQAILEAIEQWEAEDAKKLA